MSAALRKALPPRPGGDAYGSGEAGLRLNRIPEASGAAVLEGYRQDIMGGFEDKPRYNPLNKARPQSSVLLDLNDSIQVHLLVEMALGDSKEYEILSQDEVDDLKKQCQLLTQRIEQTRQNLILQTKYRDAAISMARLYSPTEQRRSADGSRRRSFLHNNRNSDQIREAEQERLASEHRCEELAQELWALEKRLMVPQKRLLEHTAGILQMSHNGPKVARKSYAGQQGIPGSPESMYTYSNARSSMEPVTEENFFDERSFYRSPDKLDIFGGAIGGEAPDYLGALTSSDKSVSEVARKLASLNNRLREMIISANPQRGTSYAQPPIVEESADSAQLDLQLEYLEQGVAVIDQEREITLQNQLKTIQSMEQSLESVSHEIAEKLQSLDSSAGSTPPPTGKDFQQQLSYLQTVLSTMHTELKGASDKASDDIESRQQNLDQVEATLMGLWDIIQSSEEAIRQQKQQRRQARAAKGLPPDSDDSGDDSDVGPESFSLQGFSAKVQSLFNQSTKLKEQKKVLQRQIKQQRELNLKSDSQKDAEIADKTEALKRTQVLLEKTEMDADSVREQLSTALTELETTQMHSTSHNTELESIQSQIAAKSSQITQLEQRLQDMQGQGAARDAEQAGMKRTLAEKEAELENANMEIASLRTEVTIARAELDGAYGSRAERAAQVAANPVIQRELEDLNKRNQALSAEIASLRNSRAAAQEGGEKVDTLKKELKEMVAEYEEMTRASIEWEREREELEGQIDRLRDEKEGLDMQLADEKVRWLGMKSPGPDGSSGPGEGGVGGRSTAVLKNEFKKMMRDAQAKSARQLRAEQAERRRLEEELRTLKRAQGPGKSGLSQSVSS